MHRVATVMVAAALAGCASHTGITGIIPMGRNTYRTYQITKRVFFRARQAARADLRLPTPCWSVLARLYFPHRTE